MLRTRRLYQKDCVVAQQRFAEDTGLLQFQPLPGASCRDRQHARQFLGIVRQKKDLCVVIAIVGANQFGNLTEQLFTIKELIRCAG
ncbi:MAG: hypothetical protein IPK16_26715 [Anaerolineales bacterium]|nr:hypothetical protein [Anaerolineales bacterium]